MANPDGHPVWFELMTDDPDAAARFYAATLPWTIGATPLDPSGGYRVATAPDGDGVAGFLRRPEGAPFAGWYPYFGHDDVDAAVAQAVAAGGTVHMPAHDAAGIGRFALVGDPQGCAFYLMKGASPEDSRAFKMAPGAFGHAVWIELATPDPAAGIDFYGALFGWRKLGAMPMGAMGEYAFIGTDAFRPGAVMSSATTGAPARWGVYFHVADIDAAIEAARGAGGALLTGPDQIPGGDYSAHLADAEGAMVGVVGPRH